MKVPVRRRLRVLIKFSLVSLHTDDSKMKELKLKLVLTCPTPLSQEQIIPTANTCVCEMDCHVF